MNTCDIKIIDTIKINCCTYSKETTLNDLEVDSRVSLYGINTLAVKSIFKDHVTLSIESTNCCFIRNFFLETTIPCCFKDGCNAQNIRIQVLKIHYIEK
ncbi:MAG: hypothetical protein RR988_04520 [Clostridia bacterium]